MPAGLHERDSLLQRLPAESAAACRLHGQQLLEWQHWRLHCGPLPLAASPAPACELEVCQLWPHSPLTPGLLLGGDPQALAGCRPLLQQLAGHEHASLYCGPLGAAGFCLRVFDGLRYVAGPGLPTLTATASPPDWVALLTQQQQLADKLAALCHYYLQRHGVSSLPPDPLQVLAAFRQPPAQQTHYALNLATLLAVALQLGAPARQLFEAAIAPPVAPGATNNNASQR